MSVLHVLHSVKCYNGHQNDEGVRFIMAQGDTERTDTTRRLEQPAQQPAQSSPPRPRPVQPPAPRQQRASAPPPIYDPYSRRQAPSPRDSGLYFPWWSLVVMIVLVGVAAFAILLVIAELSDPNTLGDQPPRVEVLNPTPTLGNQFVPTSANQSPYAAAPNIPAAPPTATVALPTPIPSPSLPPGEFAVGASVQVVGVDLSGLNVRDVPGLAGNVRFRAAEGDSFVIVEGPQTIDEMEWWRIEDPEDSDRNGWAARNFLTVQ